MQEEIMQSECPLNTPFDEFEDLKNRIKSNINNTFLDNIYKIGVKDGALNIYTFNDLMEFKRIDNISGITFNSIHSGTYIFITHEKNKFLSSKMVFYGKDNICIINKTDYGITGIVVDMGGGSLLYIDKNFSCGSCVFRLREEKDVFIGNDNMFSSEVTLWTSDGHAILDEYGKCINDATDIILGDHIWIGFRVNIIKGAFINDGSIVGIGSLVNKKFYEPNCIIAGVPSKVIKNKVRWTRKNPTHLRQYLKNINNNVIS